MNNKTKTQDGERFTAPAGSAKYVALRTLVGPTAGARFFSMNSPRPEYSATGEKWYEVIGYANSVPEAQRLCGISPND